MPHLVNGFGTWYVGKESPLLREGVCEHCGTYGNMASYDTTSYLMALYLPLVPCGKKRVIDECPGCQKHRVISLKEWKKARLEDIMEAFNELKATPEDAEKAERALAMAISYQHEESLEIAQLLINEKLGHHAKVQAFLGHTLSYFGKLDLAVEAYRRSLAAEDDPEVGEDLARALVRLERPAEAEKLLGHIFEASAADNVGLAMLLVEGYQATGDHGAALRILDRLEQTWPEYADNKEVKKYRKLSLKHRDGGKQVRSALLKLVDATVPAESKGPNFAARVAPFVGPAILLLIIGLFLFTAITAGSSRVVHVVNGTGAGYQVKINEQTIQLPPSSRVPVTVSEGAVRIRLEHPEVQDFDETVHIETSFWSRPFNDDVFVINPDRAAVLIRHRTVYTDQQAPPMDGTMWELHVGKLLYRFEDIDYVFKQFPPTIQIEKGQVSYRTRLGLSHNSPAELASELIAMKGVETTIQYLRNVLAFQPDSEAHLFTLTAYASPEALIELTRTRLADRPLRLHWHRIYQNSMERHQPSHDLVKEYKALLVADPDNTVLKYLLGRVTFDPDQAEKLFLEATAGPTPCAQAIFALAFGDLANGNFEEALELIQQAMKLEPSGWGYENYEWVAMFASGHIEELLKRNQDALIANPLHRNLIAERMALLLRGDNGIEKSRQLIREFCDQARKVGASDNDIAMVRASLEAELEYKIGNVTTAADLLATLNSPTLSWTIAMYRGDVAAASEALQGQSRVEAKSHLLVFIAAQIDGNAELTRKHLQLGIEALRREGSTERTFASWLAGEKPIDVKLVQKLSLGVDLKKVLLTALGQTAPEHRDELMKLALRLNFEKGFPAHLIERASNLASTGEGSSTRPTRNPDNRDTTAE